VHTDNQGGRTKTASLSNERARAVKRYLTQKGVASDRLQARGYGANKPIAPNFTARGRAKNNRVLFVILEGR
jgi:outer membrane protein OmpA-like peptidoglycan-associated protein